MAILVIGGHSRSVGKTAALVGILRRTPEMRWTAFKITQFGHGFCTADGAPCDCQTDEHLVAISEERNQNTGTDTSRYLQAGAVRSFWVRTRIGNLAAAMPRLRREIAAAENAIIESNSILGFLRPNLYLSVLDHAAADFKDSARLYLDRADALLLVADSAHLKPQWRGVSAQLMEEIPHFPITRPEYVTNSVIDFVMQRLSAAKVRLT